MSDDLPKIIHDTRRIISINAAMCELFRCDPVALIDSEMLELLPENDRRWLAQMRLGQMRKGAIPDPFTHIFQRCDGSLFHATVNTDRLPDGTFETTLFYIKEK